MAQKGKGSRNGTALYSTAPPCDYADCPNPWEQVVPLYWTSTGGNGDHLTIREIHDVGSAEYEVVCDDNRNLLPALKAASIDLVVTSPPYFNQRAYSSPGLGDEATAAEYLDNIMETFKEILRVMKPTGNIVYNMGDKVIDGGLQLIPYRFAARVVDELNLRLVNDITWIKQNPTPHQFPRRLTISTEPLLNK